MSQRHTNRLKAIEAGKSNLDAVFERGLIEGRLTVRHTTPKGAVKVSQFDMVAADKLLDVASKIMIEYGKDIPVWPWITAIKGLGAGSQAAKILALIDDIGKFDTVSKLWRYSGYGLYEYYQDDGKIVAPIKGKEKQGEGEDSRIVEVVPEPREGWGLVTARDRGIKGYVLPYNKTLKSTLYVMADVFIKMQTPGYTDTYYAEKKRQRELHPEKIGNNFSDGHIDNRGRRKMIKEFLRNLWLEWRAVEGLPITDQYSNQKGYQQCQSTNDTNQC